MKNLVVLHGSDALKPLLVDSHHKNEMLKLANTLKKVPISNPEKSDLLMFSMGSYTPLSGFMNESDWSKI